MSPAGGKAYTRPARTAPGWYRRGSVARLLRLLIIGFSNPSTAGAAGATACGYLAGKVTAGGRK